MLLLPRHFKPTHQTSGLPGFGAIDVFAKAGTPVALEFRARVVHLSGHPPTTTTKPGGPYGWSYYFETSEGFYYATHFGSRQNIVAIVGKVVLPNNRIGSVANYAAATDGETPSHIHFGFHPKPWIPWWA